MKTETQIAEENIEKIHMNKKSDDVVEHKEILFDDLFEALFHPCPSGTRGKVAHSILIHTSQEHKASCQRFLEKLEKKIFLLKQIDGLILWHKNRSLDVPYDWHDYEGVRLRDLKCSIGDEITDLKQAIKLYDEAGI